MATSPDPTVRSILIWNAPGSPMGAAIARVFAARGARIAFSFEGEDEPAFHLAAQLAERKAVVLPLEWTTLPGSGPEPLGVESHDTTHITRRASRLVERVVEDFGRLDMVVAPISTPGLVGEAAEPREALESAVVKALARAALPHLQRARPTGRFVVAAPCEPQTPRGSATPDLHAQVAALARDCGAKGPRPVFQAVVLGNASDTTSVQVAVAQMLEAPIPKGASAQEGQRPSC